MFVVLKRFVPVIVVVVPTTTVIWTPASTFSWSVTWSGGSGCEWSSSVSSMSSTHRWGWTCLQDLEASSEPGLLHPRAAGTALMVSHHVAVIDVETHQHCVCVSVVTLPSLHTNATIAVTVEFYYQWNPLSRCDDVKTSVTHLRTGKQQRWQASLMVSMETVH